MGHQICCKWPAATTTEHSRDILDVCRSPALLADRALQLGLDQDLQAVMLPSLPAHTGSMLKGTIAGVHVLQMVDFVDVSASAEEASKERSNHTFKLLLTDGKQEVTALEFERMVDCVTSNLYKGLKVAVKDPEVVRGCMLLKKHNFTILGGRLPAPAPTAASTITHAVDHAVSAPAAIRSTQTSKIEPAALGTQPAPQEPEILGIDLEDDVIFQHNEDTGLPDEDVLPHDSFEFNEELLALAAADVPAWSEPAHPKSLAESTANQAALLVDLSHSQVSVDFDAELGVSQEDAIEAVTVTPLEIALSDAVSRTQVSRSGGSSTFTIHVSSLACAVFNNHCNCNRYTLIRRTSRSRK
jgi:hypothetical protein